MIEKMDFVTAACLRLDPRDLALSLDLRGFVLADLEIVEIERILRVIVTADIAFATESASFLEGAKFIEMRFFRLAEIYCDIWEAELLRAPHRFCHPFHQSAFGRDSPIGRSSNRLDIQHVGGKIIVGIKHHAVISRRPSPIKDLVRGPQVHIRVDEGTASQPRSLYYHHV